MCWADGSVGGEHVLPNPQSSVSRWCFIHKGEMCFHLLPYVLNILDIKVVVWVCVYFRQETRMSRTFHCKKVHCAFSKNKTIDLIDVYCLRVSK